MKKKIFFITFAIIQIVIAIYTMVNANILNQEAIQEFKQVQESIPTELIQEETQKMMQDMIKTIEETGVASIRLTSGICILASIAMLIIAIKNTILRNKGLMIVACVLTLIFGTQEIGMLISVIGLIVLLASKRVNPEDFPVKKALPVLEKIETNKRELIIGILILLVYFSQFIWGEYVPDNKIVYYVITISFYLIVWCLSIMFWKKSIKRDLKALKENFGTYIKHILANLGWMYLANMVVNIVVILATGTITTANQEGLEAMPSWYVVPLAIFYAPIVEETIFRGVIRKGIKNKYVFIAVSAICFGLLHTITSEVTLFNVIMKSLPYATMGAFLARIYVKSDNITTSMLSHFMMNLLASLITLV